MPRKYKRICVEEDVYFLLKDLCGKMTISQFLRASFEIMEDNATEPFKELNVKGLEIGEEVDFFYTEKEFSNEALRLTWHLRYLKKAHGIITHDYIVRDTVTGRLKSRITRTG